MAEYGLKIIGANSKIQVDSSYTNMVFRQRKTKYMDAGAIRNNVISFTGYTYPMIAMGNTGGGTLMVYTSMRHSSTFSFGFAGGSGTAEFFLFDQATDKKNDYGMQVFKSNGKISFDSNNPYFKILDSFTIDTFYTGNGFTKRYSGKKVGVLLHRTMWGQVPSGSAPPFRALRIGPGFKISGDTINVSSFGLRGAGMYEESKYPEKTTVMVVDLTNIT